MKKLLGLQWARGIAAITVVIEHAVVHPFPDVGPTVHLFGRLGVTLFFVISGYIMVITTGTGRFDPLSFMKKRVLRVAPLYYVATGIAVLGVLIAPWAFRDTVFDIRHIVLSLLFIPTPEPGVAGSVDPFIRLGWTLNFEMFFYLVFACLFAFGIWARAILVTVIFGVLMVIGQMFQLHAQPIEFYTRMDTLGFVVGVWIAVLTRLDHSPLPFRLGVGIMTAAIASLAIMIAVYPQVEASLWTRVWIGATCGAMVFVFAKAPELWVRSGPPAFAYLGDASYAMYLFHMFVVGAVTVVGLRLLPDGLGIVIVAMASIGGVAIGIFAYQFVEKPTTRLIRLGTDGRRTPPVAAAKESAAP